jgi:PKD repeat protein
MTLKKISWIAIGLLVLISCIVSPVCAEQVYINTMPASEYYLNQTLQFTFPSGANLDALCTQYGQGGADYQSGNYPNYYLFIYNQIYHGYGSSVRNGVTASVLLTNAGTGLSLSSYNNTPIEASGGCRYGSINWWLGTFYYASPPFRATINATPTSGMVPLSVYFTGGTQYNTPASQWLWSFGDGYTTSAQNATHVYSAVGNYTVSLAISNGVDTSLASQTITVSAPSNYFIPVTISDALSGNLIFNSSLSSKEYGTSSAHNWTGSYGSFNVTGKGPNGINPIQYGDYIYLMGTAPGYVENDINYHVTIPGHDMFVKNIPLAPLYLAPISGESTMILDVYNNANGAPITGAYVVSAIGTSSWKTGYTDSRGVFIQSNISASEHVTVTVSASGYQTGTLNYYAPSGGTNYVSLGLNSGITVDNFWPVTIVDASTGYAISNSELDVKEDLSSAAWYNRTSTTGKFNVTGVGENATAPIVNNMDVYLLGQASGYITYGYVIMMSADNNKVTQTIPLYSLDKTPASGEFSASYKSYDAVTTRSLSGVSIAQDCSGTYKTGTTNSAGVYTTYNNTAGTCTWTASKTGYTPTTGTVTGTSGESKTILVAISSTSVNPTVTATQTITGTSTPSTAIGRASAAIDFWSNGLQIISEFAYVIVLFTLLWTFIYVAGGNIPGFKARGGFLGKLPGIFGKKGKR